MTHRALSVARLALLVALNALMGSTSKKLRMVMGLALVLRAIPLARLVMVLVILSAPYARMVTQRK